MIRCWFLRTVNQISTRRSFGIAFALLPFWKQVLGKITTIPQWFDVFNRTSGNHVPHLIVIKINEKTQLSVEDSIEVHLNAVRFFQLPPNWNAQARVYLYGLWPFFSRSRNEQQSKYNCVSCCSHCCLCYWYVIHIVMTAHYMECTEEHKSHVNKWMHTVHTNKVAATIKL